MTTAIDIFMHLDVYLNQWAAAWGAWLYLLVFVVIFCETGLVFTPLLPGDSLLFALGALCAIENAVLNLPTVCAVILTAAFLGDTSNYSIGYWLGDRLLQKDLRFFNKHHLKKTHQFFEKHGGRTIIMARFVPIVRTFAPFVAGLGKMGFKKFISFSVVGTSLWVATCVFGGFYFGNIPTVKRNFHVVILAIMIISVIPMALEFFKGLKKSKSRAI